MASTTYTPSLPDFPADDDRDTVINWGLGADSTAYLVRRLHRSDRPAQEASPGPGLTTARRPLQCAFQGALMIGNPLRDAGVVRGVQRAYQSRTGLMGFQGAGAGSRGGRRGRDYVAECLPHHWRDMGRPLAALGLT